MVDIEKIKSEAVELVLFGGAMNTTLKRMKRVKRNTPSWEFVDFDALQEALLTAQRAIREAYPYTTCPMCRSQDEPGCNTCRGTGWLPKKHYELLVPKSIRDMRKAK